MDLLPSPLHRVDQQIQVLYMMNSAGGTDCHSGPFLGETLLSRVSGSPGMLPYTGNLASTVVFNI